MIKVNNLLKIFNKNKANEVRAVNNVSVEFPEKGLVAIYGASGSGKTTFMNALGGLDKFDGGEIIMNGNVYKSSVDDKYRIENIGYIFQNYLLDERLDVYQNVAQGLRTVGVKDEEVIFDRVMTALDNVGMRDYYKRNVTTLSGGQQQRVAIARAMVKGARIILADEPTGNLDELNTRTVMELLKALSTNCLVIVVTHEGDLIEKYADSVIQIKDGRIENLSEGGKISHGTSDKTRVFLGDKKKNTLTVDNVNIDYYGEALPVNLMLVNEGGKIYLKTTDKNVRLIDEKSEIKFEDKTEKEFLEEQRVKAHGAMNFLSNVQTGKTGKVFSFKSAFVSGVKSIFNKKKRFTLFTVSVFVFMIAIVIFVGVLGSKIFKYDNIGSDFNENLIRVAVNEKKKKKEVDNIIAQKGYDVEYAYVTNFSSRMEVGIAGFETLETIYWSFLDYTFNDIEKVKNMKWIYGTPDDLTAYDRIVISKGLADDILSSWLHEAKVNGVGYEILYNATVKMDRTKTVKIVGVVDEDESYAYMEDLLWIDVIFGYSPDSYFGEEAKDGEVLLSPGWNYEDGRVVDIFGKKFVVRNSDKVIGWVINENEMRALEDRFENYREYCILTPDANKLADTLIETGMFSNIKTKNIMYKQAMDEVKEEIIKFVIVVAILIAIMLVSAALMFYSALSGKAKEIGLYRAIGVSTKNIVYKFFVESLALILICVVSVFVVIGLPVLIFSDGTLLYFPLWLFFTAIAGIAGCMMIVSLLPILSFTRKTPVEILSKYDV